MAKEIYNQVFDVVVAGGGVSGCAAAVSAARSGASVLLLEQLGYAGGTLTGCGVGPMMTFHAGQKQVIRGFMQEVVDELVQRGYSLGYLPDTKQYTDTLTAFDAEGLKLVLDDLLRGVGCRVLFHTFVGAAERKDRRVAGITVCNKDGLNSVRARVFIDATGDGDIAAWAGAPMAKGRPEDGAAQPMSMMAKYSNVDTAALKQHVLTHLKDFPTLQPHAGLLREDLPIDIEGFAKEMAAEKAAGRLSIARENILMHGTNRPGEYIVNTTRIIGHDGTDAASLSEAECIGRRQCEELDCFLRRYVPGFAEAMLEFTGPSVGVRSSRQLKGTYTLTAEDILTCRRFKSVIAHSAYPIDIHNPSGAGTDSTFLRKRGTYYDIPYEILYCPEIENLLVVGRCVSATFEAQAAIRTTPTAGAIGQAGGAAAALAARESGDVRSVDIGALQDALLRQKAYLDVEDSADK